MSPIDFGVIASSSRRRSVPGPSVTFDGVVAANTGATWSETIDISHAGTAIALVLWRSSGGDWINYLGLNGTAMTADFSAGWGQSGAGTLGVGLYSIASQAGPQTITVEERNSRMDVRVGIWSSPHTLTYRAGAASARASQAEHAVTVGAAAGDLLIAGCVTDAEVEIALAGQSRHLATRFAMTDLTAAGGDTVEATLTAAQEGRIIAGAYY